MRTRTCHAPKPMEGLTMRGRIRTSFIIALAEEHPMLPRLLQSIALQRADAEDYEILIAGPPRVISDAMLWEAVVDHPITTVTVDKDSPNPAIRNAAAKVAQGDLLHFLMPESRLDRGFLAEMTAAAKDVPEADVIYSDYVRMAESGGRGASGVIRLMPFDDDRQREREILGPSVCMRTALFRELNGYREDAVYPDWDLRIRAAQMGKAFLHTAYPLLSVPQRKVGFRERALDGRGKAMLVINNPGYFHGHTLRWALSHLRGEKWAEAGSFMVIPNAMETTRMLHEQTMNDMDGGRAAAKAVRQFENNVIPFSA